MLKTILFFIDDSLSIHGHHDELAEVLSTSLESSNDRLPDLSYGVWFSHDRKWISESPCQYDNLKYIFSNDLQGEFDILSILDIASTFIMTNSLDASSTMLIFVTDGIFWNLPCELISDTLKSKNLVSCPRTAFIFGDKADMRCIHELVTDDNIIEDDDEFDDELVKIIGKVR